MAFNEELLALIKASLQSFPEEFVEKRMFGGVAFLYKGKMTVGVLKNDLMVRVLNTKIDSELKKEFVRPMDFTGKPMKEFIFVAVEVLKTEADVQYWIELGFEHAKSKFKIN